MLSFSSFLLELYDMEIAIVIDGCLFAPVEQIVYGLLRYELALIALVTFFVCLVLVVWECVRLRKLTREVLK